MKTCLLCQMNINPRHKLCYNCYRQYKHCMHDDWFIALVEMQKVQDRIDIREQYDLDSRSNVDLYGAFIDKPVKSKRRVGRPGTSIKLIEEILRLYDASVEDELYNRGKRLSLRAIERLMNRRVKFLTIWKILKMYRREIFNKKLS